MLALEQYSAITGINYAITDDPTQATFRLITTESDFYGAYMYPQDPAFGTQQGIGAFNILSGGWAFDQQRTLVQGGWATLDSNNNGVLDDADAFVSVGSGATVLDLGAALGGAAGLNTLTLTGITGLTNSDFWFGP